MLGEPWTELARIVQSYITCDGRKDVVRPRHLKLLAVLKQKCTINLPAFLNSLLHDIACGIRKAQHADMVVSHHCLIRLIVSYSLTQQQTSWEELISSIEGCMALPTPRRKRMAGSIAGPSTYRQSSRLKRSKKVTEELPSSSAQPLQLNSSDEEEQPRYSDEEEASYHTDGEKQSEEEEIRYSDEEEIEEDSEEEEVEGEIRYSDEEGSYHTCDANSSKEDETEPVENVNTSPLQEDKLAQILANMSNYARSLDPNNDINQMPE